MKGAGCDRCGLRLRAEWRLWQCPHPNARQRDFRGLPYGTQVLLLFASRPPAVGQISSVGLRATQSPIFSSPIVPNNRSICSVAAMKIKTHTTPPQNPSTPRQSCGPNLLFPPLGCQSVRCAYVAHFTGLSPAPAPLGPSCLSAQVVLRKLAPRLCRLPAAGLRGQRRRACCRQTAWPGLHPFSRSDRWWRCDLALIAAQLGYAGTDMAFSHLGDPSALRERCGVPGSIAWTGTVVRS
jgi:hypothetical protein